MDGKARFGHAKAEAESKCIRSGSAIQDSTHSESL